MKGSKAELSTDYTYDFSNVLFLRIVAQGTYYFTEEEKNTHRIRESYFPYDEPIYNTNVNRKNVQ